MEILADQRIPLVEETLQDLEGDIGDEVVVQYFDGERANPTTDQLQRADVLLVRSVTKVDEGLLANSSVKSVLTATSGTDHIDLAYLRRCGITFFNAAGVNSNAVREYVLWVIFHYLSNRIIPQTKHSELKVGVVGCGNIGSKLWESLDYLGLQVKVFDPPRERLLQNEKKERSEISSNILFCRKEELYDCDILTFHVPYTNSKNGGKDATENLFDEDWLSRIIKKTKEGQEKFLLVNTSRPEIISPVVYQKLKSLERDERFDYCFDVWPDEPVVEGDLVRGALLATPHLAGHSLWAREGATRTVLKKWCREYLRHHVRHQEVRRNQMNQIMKIRQKKGEGTKNLENLLNFRKEESYYLENLPKIFSSLEECSQKFKDNPQVFISLRSQYGKRKELQEVDGDGF